MDELEQLCHPGFSLFAFLLVLALVFLSTYVVLAVGASASD